MNLPSNPTPTVAPTLTPTLTVTATNTQTSGQCGNCGTHERWFLHHVRVRGVYRRLCTNCVLRLLPSSFCPSCFTFYDANPPPTSQRLSCSKCPSVTHSHCVSSPPSFPFICSSCTDPNFPSFQLKPDEATNTHAIDKNMATVLLCAARIAAATMAKAVNVARAEAERKVREAATCRKRAREALEHVALLVKRKEMESSTGVSGNLGRFAREGVDGPPSKADAQDVNNSNGNAKVNDKMGGLSDGGFNNGSNGELKPNLQQHHISNNANVKVKDEGINSNAQNNS